MDFILANWQSILVTVLAVMGGLVVALMPLAKMTHTEWDNKILGWISTAVAFLSKFVTPKVAPPKTE